MRSTLLAVFLLSAPAQAAWNLDNNYAISPGMTQSGLMVDLNSNTAISPFQKGPQLESSFSSALGRGTNLHRFGLGLRQELHPALAVASHALIVSADGASRFGVEGALSWKFWKPKNPANAIGLGLYLYGGTTAEKDDPFSLWWSGAGLQMSFGS